MATAQKRDRHPAYFTADAAPARPPKDTLPNYYHAEISISQWRSSLPRPHDTLLAQLNGVELYPSGSSNNAYPSFRLTVEHPSLYDDDHSTVYLVRAELENPVFTYVSPAITQLHAVIRELYAYPPGSGPQDVTDSSTWQDTCKTCSPHHQFGRYLPPSRDDLKALIGSVVHVTLTPARGTLAPR
jgi:hypothetical protein